MDLWFIKVGLALDIFGVITILVPILERVGQRLHSYFSNEIRDFNPWDMANQDPRYHRRNDAITMFGIALLLLGFLFQYFGNL